MTNEDFLIRRPRKEYQAYGQLNSYFTLSSFREFLFANVARCGVGWINRHDIDYHKEFGMAYLGMATEMYYREEIV